MMNFVIGRVGSAAGASLFNKSTSSCDVFDKNGNPCCADKKEAKKKGMNYCGSKDSKKN